MQSLSDIDLSALDILNFWFSSEDFLEPNRQTEFIIISSSKDKAPFLVFMEMKPNSAISIPTVHSSESRFYASLTYLSAQTRFFFQGHHSRRFSLQPEINLTQSNPASSRTLIRTKLAQTLRTVPTLNLTSLCLL